MTAQMDLFGDVTWPHGFSYIPEFLSEEEELFLLSKMAELNWKEFSMHGVTARRRVVHFGYEYTFSGRALEQTEEPPAYVKPLLSRVARLLKVRSGDIQEILFTYYPQGAPIGWHRDAPMFESLVGVSLQGPCRLKLRKMSDHSTSIMQVLERRSAYVIQGEARWLWQHHIPPVKEDRFSITFRTLKKGKGS